MENRKRRIDHASGENTEVIPMKVVLTPKKQATWMWLSCGKRTVHEKCSKANSVFGSDTVAASFQTA